MPTPQKARVFRNGRSQAVRILAQYRFQCDEVYIQRNAATGVISISEKPFAPSIEEIFRMFDEAGASDFIVERDQALPRPALEL